MGYFTKQCSEQTQHALTKLPALVQHQHQEITLPGPYCGQKFIGCDSPLWDQVFYNHDALIMGRREGPPLFKIHLLNNSLKKAYPRARSVYSSTSGSFSSPRIATERSQPLSSASLSTPSSGSRAPHPALSQSAGLNTNKTPPSLPLQPTPKPLTVKELAVEINLVYHDLIQGESKCINVVTIVSLERRLRPADWGYLLAIHRHLIYEHNDFFLPSKHNSANPASPTLQPSTPRQAACRITELIHSQSH